MLDFMRKKAGSWMIKFILGAIIVVFVFWGVGSFTDRSATGVATVNGEVITVDAYREAYDALLEQVRRQFGESLNDDLLKTLNLKRQTIDRLIDQALWAQEAHRLGIQVSEDEVAAAIGSVPVFQTAGVFDPRRYQAVLTQNRLTVDQFENMQKQAMLVEKLRLFIAGGVMVSEDEARRWYDWNDTSMRIDYVVLKANDFSDIEPTEEEIAAYYEAHKDEYKSEVKLKARYLRFSPSDYEAEVEISDDRVAQYYENHTGDFTTPPTVEARHILLRLDSGADADSVEAKRLLAAEIATRARAGEDFAELAKSFSEGPTRDNGGWLGAFKREDMVKPFSDAAFALEGGGISDPVKTQFGWHVIKVEKKNAGGTRSLEQVKEEIRATLKTAEAKNLAYDEAVAVFDSTLDGEPLSGTSEDTAVQETEIFGRQGPQGVGDPVGFAQAAFKLDVLGISDITELGDGYYIIQVTEKIPSELQPLKEVKARVTEDLRAEQRDKAAAAAAEELLGSLKKGESLEELAAAAGKKVVTTDYFKRTGSIPGLGFERQISEAAFDLREQKPVADAVVKGAQGYFVIRLKDKRMPDLEEFEKQKATIKDELTQRKQVKAFEAWLAKNRSESDIVIEQGFIE